MDTFDLKRGYRRAKKTNMISIRVEPKNYAWMQQKNLSPTRIFDDALLRLKKRKKW